LSSALDEQKETKETKTINAYSPGPGSVPAAKGFYMKIYTKTGDAGETGLFAGARVLKDDVRIEAYGTVDELNAALGLARCESLPPEVDQSLERVHCALFSVGAELATPNPDERGTALTSASMVAALERAIDNLDAGLPPLKHFILPAGTRAAALLHVARSVCRRAERRVVTLRQSAAISPLVVQYLNRLGDYLFVAARFVNQEAHVDETIWRKPV
jgi:cob(I)alamin adenosyltransferase